jgi:hypothetical protein
MIDDHERLFEYLARFHVTRQLPVSIHPEFEAARPPCATGSPCGPETTG